MLTLNRRTFMQGAAGTALVAATGTRAFAQTSRPLVVGSYAGVFEKAMRETFVKAFTEKTGVPVELSIGGPSQWLSQIEANPENPPVDVILTSPRDAIREGATGRFDKMDPAKLSNLADIPPVFVDGSQGWAVAFDYGGCGLSFNSDRIANPPKSIKEFVQRTIDGEWVATLPTLSWQATPSNLIWSFNDALGGTVDDITPFIEAMQKMKPNLIFWSGLPDFVTQLQSGDAEIGVYTDGRTWATNKSGNEWLKFINPEEGAVIEAIVAMKPKASHPAAWDFINTMLDPVEQSNFADISYYGMTNTKVVYSDSVKDMVTRWEQGRMVPTDKVAAVTAQWVERWNKELGF